MAWQIKIHTLNVGQGDAQIIEVWDQVEPSDKEYKKWAKQKKVSLTAESLKQFAQEYVEWQNSERKKDPKSMDEEVSPKYQAILIDGGDKKNNDNYNYKLIYNFVATKEIRITRMLLTHFDEDHYGGWMDLIKEDINSIYFNSLLITFRKILEFFRIDDKNKYHIAIVLYKNLFNFENEALEKINVDINIDSTKDQISEYLKQAGDLLKNYKSKLSDENFHKLLDIPHLFNPSKFSDLTEIDFSSAEKLKAVDARSIINIYSEGDHRILDAFGGEINEKTILQNVEFIYPDKDSCKGTLKDTTPKSVWEDIDKFVRNDRSSLLKDFSNIEIKHRKKTCKEFTIGCLGTDILGFSEGNLEIYNKQKLKDKPGLFVVIGKGKIYDFQKKKLTTTLTNSSSIGLLFVYKTFTYLTCGDLTDLDGDLGQNGNPKNYGNSTDSDLESILAKRLNNEGYRELSLMKIGHHGSHEGTSNYVLDKLKPNWVIISCGNLKSHDHPTREMLHRLYNNDCVKKIYTTGSGVRYGLNETFKDYNTYDTYDKWYKDNKSHHENDGNEITWLKKLLKAKDVENFVMVKSTGKKSVIEDQSIDEYFDEFLNGKKESLFYITYKGPHNKSATEKFELWIEKKKIKMQNDKSV